MQKSIQLFNICPDFVLNILLKFYFYRFLKESARWLMSKRRYEECKVVLQYMASRNKTKLPLDLNIKQVHQNSVNIVFIAAEKAE